MSPADSLLQMHSAPDAQGGVRGGRFPWWSGDPQLHLFLRTLLLYRSVSDQSGVARWVRNINPITLEDVQQCLKPCDRCYWGCDLLVTDVEY